MGTPKPFWCNSRIRTELRSEERVSELISQDGYFDSGMENFNSRMRIEINTDERKTEWNF